MIPQVQGVNIELKPIGCNADREEIGYVVFILMGASWKCARPESPWRNKFPTRPPDNCQDGVHIDEVHNAGVQRHSLNR